MEIPVTVHISEDNRFYPQNNSNSWFKVSTAKSVFIVLVMCKNVFEEKKNGF